MNQELREAIRAVSDFPKEGVLYWDTTGLLSNPKLFREAVAIFSAQAEGHRADCIGAIEAKGFPLGGAVAYATGLPLILIRKSGLTAGEVHKVPFVKEYGDGSYELRPDALGDRRRVYLLYDILAASGAVRAAVKLIESCDAKAVGAGFVLELMYLNGRQALRDVPLTSLLKVPKAVPLQ